MTLIEKELINALPKPVGFLRVLWFPPTGNVVHRGCFEARQILKNSWEILFEFDLKQRLKQSAFEYRLQAHPIAV